MPSIRAHPKWIGVAGGLAILLVLLYFFAGNRGEEKRVGYYLVGRDSTWYPLDLKGREMNMVGFSSDLLDAVASEGDFLSQVVSLGPEQLFFFLDTGEIDAVFSSIDQTVSTKKRYRFSDPVYPLGLVLVVRRDSTIEGPGDLDGKILGVESNVSGVYHIPERPLTIIIPYNTLLTALEKLEENQIDAVLAESLEANIFMQGHFRGRLKVGSHPLTQKAIRLITLNTPKGEQLIRRFNRGLAEFRTGSGYKKAVEKWGLVSMED